jgi:hypothetical protein
MFKPSITLADVPDAARPHAIRLRTVLLAAMVLVLVPLAAEAALKCYGQWCEVMGSSAEVQTPIIDSIGEGIQTARASLAEDLGPAWYAATHDPYVALPAATILIVVAMALLKRYP